jgi:hypothetical protein
MGTLRRFIKNLLRRGADVNDLECRVAEVEVFRDAAIKTGIEAIEPWRYSPDYRRLRELNCSET